MEEYLSRKLNTRENVHHINEDKHDNRIENLEIIDVSEHTRRHMIGHLVSLETKKKIGDANRVSLTGRKLSQAHKLKISASLKGKNTWSKGRKLSPETKEKMSISKRKQGITKT